MEFRRSTIHGLSNHRQSANPDIDAQQGLEGTGFAAEQPAEKHTIIDAVADLPAPADLPALFRLPEASA